VTGLLVLAVVASGCATDALWDERRHYAAENPNLVLSMPPEGWDILVQFDEQSEGSGKIRRRAYWLFSPVNVITIDGAPRTLSKPAFVNPSAYPGLQPIPVFHRTPSAEEVPELGLFAVSPPPHDRFELWHDGTLSGHYELPSYYKRPEPTAGRVLLTPFALLADGGIVVAVTAAGVGLVVLVLYAKSETD
jgi:hypothetical protein